MTDNNLRISLWNNPKSQSDQKQPVLKGSVNINGVEYWVSLWNGKQGAPNAPRLTGSLQVKEQQGFNQAQPQQQQFAAQGNGGAQGGYQQPAQNQAPNANQGFGSDDIPF